MLYIFYLLKDDIILRCPVLFHYNVQEQIDEFVVKKKKSIYKLLFSITICTAECEKLGKSVILFSIFSLKKRVLFYFDLNCLSHALNIRTRSNVLYAFIFSAGSCFGL